MELKRNAGDVVLMVNYVDGSVTRVATNVMGKIRDAQLRRLGRGDAAGKLIRPVRMFTQGGTLATKTANATGGQS